MIASHPAMTWARMHLERCAGCNYRSETDKLLGYRVNAAKPEAVWLDEKLAATQRRLIRATQCRQYVSACAGFQAHACQLDVGYQAATLVSI